MTVAGFNPLEVSPLGLALEGPVRPKRAKARGIRERASTLARISRGAPEVVVKVSGSGKSRQHSRAHLTYITRNGKLRAENERGEPILGRDALRQVHSEWSFHTAGDSERRRAQSVNLVLSMPAGTDPQAVLAASREFATATFAANHQYVLVLHDDTAHPHVHLAVKAQGFDLLWLRRSKADLQAWREVFAERLRDQGVDAEATPRRARGVIRKSESQALWHLAKDKRSTVVRAKVATVLRELHLEPAQPTPWETSIRGRQRQVRSAYRGAVEQLRLAAGMSKEAAARLSRFLDQMPRVETEREQIKTELLQLLRQSRTPVADVDATPRSPPSSQLEDDYR